MYRATAIPYSGNEQHYLSKVYSLGENDLVRQRLVVPSQIGTWTPDGPEQIRKLSIT